MKNVLQTTWRLLSSQRLLMLVFVLAIATTGYAQTASKLSGGTRIVLSQYNAKKTTPKSLNKISKKRAFSLPEIKAESSCYAEPETVNGVDVLSVWVKLSDNNFAALKSIQGVEVRAEFDKICTARIAIDAIDKVAALSNVERIVVGTKKTTQTDDVRIATNVDDILNFTADAANAGLDKAYDGTGVIVGVIDQGIDFNHSWFQDADGNTRIKRAYLFNSETKSFDSYNSDQIPSLTTDYDGKYHGTHVASIAGGSNFTWTGDWYDTKAGTVIQDGTPRVFGGMAPGADLVLCGMGPSGMTDTYLAEAIKTLFDYADEQGKPMVINYSIGGEGGPHDGTGLINSVLETYKAPGHIFCASSANYGATALYHTATATSLAPARTIITLGQYGSLTSNGNTIKNMLHNGTVHCYGRDKNVELSLDLAVVNVATNQLVFEWNDITESTILSCNTLDQSTEGVTYSSELASMFEPYQDNAGEGQIRITFDHETFSGKPQIFLQFFRLFTLNSSSYVTTSGTTYTGNLKFAISIKPKELGTTIVDSWGVSPATTATSTSTAFTSGTITTTDGTYTYTGASYDCTISDDATSPNVISVGAYTTKNKWPSANNTGGGYTSVTGDLGSLYTGSAYATAASPAGRALPDIMAPGRVVFAAGSKYGDVETMGKTYFARNYDDNNRFYGTSGTSMSSPVVAGTVALWLQAKPDLTTEQVRNILYSTAVTDSYTSVAKAGASGKLDALSGFTALLGKAQIKADKSEVAIYRQSRGISTEVITITGVDLTSDVTAQIIDPDNTNVFTIDKTTLDKDAVEGGGVQLTVTYNAPTEEGELCALLRLTSTNSNILDIELRGGYYTDGVANANYLDLRRYMTITEQGWYTKGVDQLYGFTKAESGDYGWLTMPMRGAYYASKSSSSSYSPKQNWIQSGQTYMTTTSFSGTSPFLGSAAYFTSATAGAFGRTATQTTATAECYITYYVTNVEEVRLRGYIGTGNNSNYPMRIRAYECQVSSTGTVTTSSSYTKQARVTTTPTSAAYYICTMTGLDPKTVYAIRCSVYRGNMAEVAFKVPLEYPRLKSANVSSNAITLATTTESPVSTTINVTGENLTDGVTLTLDDPNNVFTLDRTFISAADAQRTTSKAPNVGIVPLASSTGQDVNLTLSATSEGLYDATVIASTPGATPMAISVTGEVTLDPLTGVPQVRISTKDDAWYTLQGLRLSKAPTTKGVYIHNGKKVLVK